MTDQLAAAIEYAITTCAVCGRELAVAADLANELFLCADCDRPGWPARATEPVIPIEEDCGD